MDDGKVVPLDMKHPKTVELMKRFLNLPKWQQNLIRGDMETAFENRIKFMEKINHGKTQTG